MSLGCSQNKVFFEVHAAEVGVLFALGEVLDAFLHVITDTADGDLAIFVGGGFAIEGFHEGVGEEAVGLLATLEGVFRALR